MRSPGTMYHSQPLSLYRFRKLVYWLMLHHLQQVTDSVAIVKVSEIVVIFARQPRPGACRQTS